VFSSLLIRIIFVCFTAIPIICFPQLVFSQGIQQTPYSAADTVRRGLSVPPDMSPSNPLGLPGSSLLGPRGSDSIPISSGLFQGLLPSIPNLQFGYIYNFGQYVRAGRASIDYLLPINLSPDTTVYGEVHSEFQSFWKNPTGSANNRVDLSLGGGYRRMLGSKALIGINGFFDNTRLFGSWYSSGSAGLEMAAEIAGNDAIDLNFNWYGRLFNSAVLSNAFRYGPSNYDFQVGYSHELYGGGPDLRLSATGYKFQAGSNVYGYYGGAELKSRDGMFVAKYDVGYDRLNKTYHSVAGYINMGFQVENLLSGKSPLAMPEPIFKSPRNLRRLLTRTADRNFYQPTSVVVNRNFTPTPPGPTPPGPTPDPPTPYFLFTLVDNSAPNEYYAQFDQPINTAVTALTFYWSIKSAKIAMAAAIGIQVIDPGGVLPKTITVNEQSGGGSLLYINICNQNSVNFYNVPTDGSVFVIGEGIYGYPISAQAVKSPSSSTFQLRDWTTGLVQPLTVTVSSY